MKILRTNPIRNSVDTMSIDQLIKYARRGQGVYIKLLKEITLWQLNHPEEYKILPYTDEELITLISHGIKENGTIRVCEYSWLSPNDLKAAIDNPAVYSYLKKKAISGDSHSLQVVNEYEQDNEEKVNGLINKICFSNKPLNSIDINDINRIVVSRRLAEGLTLSVPIKINQEFWDSIFSNIRLYQTFINGLIIFIGMNPLNSPDKHSETNEIILNLLGLTDIAKDIDAVPGFGLSDEIEPGYLDITFIVGYRPLNQ
ncbi:MAG: hypothetical protein J1F20_04910 [Muribaculaceae bacterium]|nr:hypothetical protein [Muribaculaceae bacterium]